MTESSSNAASWLEQRACRTFDGHKCQWTKEDAHNIKLVIRRLYELEAKETE
jgi:hypothetical protein